MHESMGSTDKLSGIRVNAGLLAAAKSGLLWIWAACSALYSVFIAFLASQDYLTHAAIALLFGVLFLMLALTAVFSAIPGPSRPLVLVAGAAILVAIGIRAFFYDYQSNDYTVFLAEWMAYFRENGGFSAIGGKIGDYNFPYLYFLAFFSYLPTDDLYLIKFLSVLFDLVLAYSVLKLTSHFTSRPWVLLGSFLAVLLLPTVVVNSSLWGQCDSIYSALGLLGLYFGLKKRPVLSVVFAALAFSFKLQIIFLLPIYMILLITGKVKIRHLLIFPFVYLLTVLPAILIGRPISDIVTIYTNQVGTYSAYLTLNAPSVYAFLGQSKSSSVLSAVGILAAFAALFVLFAYAFVRRRHFSDRSILTAAVLMVVLVPFLLPSMHDRYFYLSDVLTVVLAFLTPGLLPVPLLAEFASWTGYHAYLLRGGPGVRIGAAALLVAAVVTFQYFVRLTEREAKQVRRNGAAHPDESDAAHPDKTVP